jgi:hypothetical protein
MATPPRSSEEAAPCASPNRLPPRGRQYGFRCRCCCPFVAGLLAAAQAASLICLRSMHRSRTSLEHSSRTRLGRQLGLPLAYVYGIIGCRVHHGNGGPVTSRRTVFPQCLVVSRPLLWEAAQASITVSVSAYVVCGSPVDFCCAVASAVRRSCGGVELDHAFMMLKLCRFKNS